jgi:hypothetical protein
MKKRFVFVGGLPSHMMGVVSFTQWGQSANLTDEQARDLARGGARIVPAEEFDALGVTTKNLAKYAPFGAHQNADSEFLAQKNAAVAMAEKFAEACEAPVATEGEAL